MNIKTLLIKHFDSKTITWDKIFSLNPGTEDVYVGSIASSNKEGFVHYANVVLNSSSLVRYGVTTISDPSIEEWLSAVRNHFGEEFYLQVVPHFISDPNARIWSYRLNEQHIYGSSRLGITERNLPIARQPINETEVNYVSANGDSSMVYSYDEGVEIFYRGEKRYELSNHLGNVLAVITDRRIQSCGAGEVMHYNAQIVSVSDYYPFGMTIKERSWSDTSFNYRFGFNGYEREDDIAGAGSVIDFGARIYDSRLGKFFSIDPISYPHWSPYQYDGNCPISIKDLFGMGVGDDPKYHKTGKGDTYGALAQKYKTSVANLREWNGYEDTKIPIGAQLIVGWNTKSSADIKSGGNGGHSGKTSSIVEKVTSTAEEAAKIYSKVELFAKEHPNSVNIANAMISPVAWSAKQTVPSNLDDQGWSDLFNIWLFELEVGFTGNTVTYGQNAATTKSLQKQEGIANARNLALARARVGNNNPISTSWTFGVNAAKESISNKNMATAFLGSYSIKVTTFRNSETNVITITYKVMNTSGWDSGTRFRKDNNGDGVHDGVVPDKSRGDGIKLGGNLNETWIWTETY